MPSSLTRNFERLTIDSVRNIEITAIVTDNGTHYRAIRVFGEPMVNGTPTMVLDLRLTSDAETDLKVSTPELNF